MKPSTSSTANKLYEAFSRHDGRAMAALYHPSARFSDPVFPLLIGPDIGKMWRMLTERSPELKLEFHILEETPTKATVNWIARYPFSKTGRPVCNNVRSSLTLENGLILTQTDDFSFWAWSRQALGPAGWLLGWSPFLRNSVRTTAAKSLAKFQN